MFWACLPLTVLKSKGIELIYNDDLNYENELVQLNHPIRIVHFQLISIVYSNKKYFSFPNLIYYMNFYQMRLLYNALLKDSTFTNVDTEEIMMGLHCSCIRQCTTSHFTLQIACLCTYIQL